MLDIFTAANLFQEPLYEVNAFATTTELQASTVNPTKVVILFKHQQKELPTEEHALLSKILTAVQIDIQQVILLNIHHTSLTTFSYIQRALQPNHLICFGIHHHHIGLNIAINAYQLRYFLNCKILLANSLDQISKDNRQKRMLWTSLQKMFDIV